MQQGVTAEFGYTVPAARMLYKVLLCKRHCAGPLMHVPKVPFAAFSSSEQLRGPSGQKAAPGTYSKEIELDFIVMPLACSSSLLSRYRISPTSFG